MYEGRTQNYDQKFTKNILYMIHPFPCHIIYSYVQTKKLKNLKFGLLSFF